VAEDREWLTDEQAAERIGIPETTFDDLVEEGIIPPPELDVNKKVTRWRRHVIDAVKVLLPWLIDRLRRK
jgi:predicted DNA-binding transcriptional regulator AlpA